MISLDPQPKSDEKHLWRAPNREKLSRCKEGTLHEFEKTVVMACLPPARQTRILSCGTDNWVQWSPSTGRFRLVGNRCGCRMCPLCRFRWVRALRERMESRLAQIPRGRAKLVTLTMRSTSAPLATQIDNLWESFRRLRQRRLWKDAVAGSITVLEITFNRETDCWHPHLHIVADASFIPQKTLSNAWLQASRSSKIVDVRAIRDVEKTSKYLTGYLTKTPDLPTDDGGTKRLEHFECMLRKRLFRCHGSLRKPVEKPKRLDDYPTDWEPYLPLLTMIERAARGDVAAQRILRDILPKAALPLTG